MTSEMVVVQTLWDVFVYFITKPLGKVQKLNITKPTNIFSAYP